MGEAANKEGGSSSSGSSTFFQRLGNFYHETIRKLTPEKCEKCKRRITKKGTQTDCEICHSFGFVQYVRRTESDESGEYIEEVCSNCHGIGVITATEDHCKTCSNNTK